MGEIMKINYDVTDLLFRVFFSLIFLALGAEHIVDDALIQGMMPEWLPLKRLFSLGAGAVLLSGGFSVMLGFKPHLGASMLAVFLILVTVMIHLPALMNTPEGLPSDWAWLWEVYQRSNTVKNLCLFGVCLHLGNHETGKYCLDAYLAARKAA